MDRPIDHCREKEVNPEIARFQNSGVGSAIQRDRSHRAREAELMVLLEREKAATERAAELAKVNEEVRQRGHEVQRRSPALGCCPSPKTC